MSDREIYHNAPRTPRERDAGRATPQPPDAGDYANDDDRSRRHGEFFAVDLREFERACGLQSINVAVSYLVMARGTGGDNRTTSWSVNAIEQRTGISRPRAKAAVDLIIAEHLASVGGTAKRPRYRLMPPPGAPKDYEPDWVWLPNALVDPGDGKGLGALSPVERLRKAQDLETVRLLVSLYHAQSLANDGGLDWRKGGIRIPYERQLYGRVGVLNVWGFSQGVVSCSTSAPFARRHVKDGKFHDSFWQRLQLLKSTGLLEWVPHLMDSDNQEAEIIHPIGPFSIGEGHEQALWAEADDAARSMLAAPLLARVDADCPTFLAPVPCTSPKVSVVGIGRLRYRARTHATAKWFRDMNERCEEASARYRAYARGEQRADAA